MAAPTRENTGFNSNSALTASSTMTVAFTATASTKRIYIGVGVGASVADPISVFESSGWGITWNAGAQTFTGIVASQETDGSFCGTKWYYLDNPTAGSGGIAVKNGSAATMQIAAGAIGYTDTGITDASYINTASTANPSVTCTGSASGDDVLGIVFSDCGPNATTTETDTLIGEVEDLASDTDCNVQVGSASGASFVSDWTCSDTTNNWSVSALTVTAPLTITTVNATPGTWSWAGSTAKVVRDPETAFQPNVFQSNAFQIYGGSTGGGPTTINATTGTWSWAGANSPLAVQQISAAIGTWSWAGTTATIPTMIAATPGTWSWAGSAATIDVQQISQTTGTWSWAGSNSPPAVQQINQTIGTWSWAGSAQTISIQEINQIQGTWSWAGTTQTITTPGGATEINAVPGTWTWAGAQATLEVPQINQTTGTFSWAGTTQTFNQLINAIPGTWTWEGTIQGIVGSITVQQDLGAGGVAKRKYRKRFVVEVDGELFEVRSEQEAVNILEQLVELAKKQAEVTVERAQKAKKRPKRKVLADARKSLVIPKIEANRWLSDMADQAMLKIEEIYEDALRIIEIGALLKKRDDDDEDEIATILLML